MATAPNIDGGFNAVDTADVYSGFVPGNKGGESETVLGNWFAEGGRRDKVILAELEPVCARAGP